MATFMPMVFLAGLLTLRASEPLDLNKVELHVIASGDTINFFDARKQDIIECHLAGIEAPPPVKRGSNVQDFAKQAREWLANRLKPVYGQKSELKIKDLGDIDEVRQVILYMGDSSVSINEQLIALGLAIHQDTGSAGLGDFDDRLEKAERQALMFRKGIWDVAKQETNEIVINIAQGRKLRRDEAFYTYIGSHDSSVYEVRCIFRDIRNDKLYFTESATGRNAQSPSFQNEVEIPIFDRMGTWDYREYGRDHDRPKRFRFGVMNTHVWLCSVGETKRQTRVVKPGDPNMTENNPGGDKKSFQ
jgi:endonuclease YncB( thermonuclease family)